MRPESIIQVVAEEFMVSPKEMLGRSRSRRISTARQTAMWAMKEAGFTYTEVAIHLKRTCHTTCIYGHKQTESRMRYDESYRDKIMAIFHKRYPDYDNMDINESVDIYYRAKRAYEMAKEESNRLHKVMQRREADLVDAMLASHTRSIGRDDGTTPHLVQHTNVSVTKDNFDAIRQWLLEDQGDDADYVEEVVSKPAVTELVKKKLEEGADESELPDFLKVNTRPSIGVTGWKKFREEENE